jgi:hypothetical protein
MLESVSVAAQYHDPSLHFKFRICTREGPLYHDMLCFEILHPNYLYTMMERYS